MAENRQGGGGGGGGRGGRGGQGGGRGPGGGPGGFGGGGPRGGNGEIASWVASTFTATTVGGATVYDLAKPAA